MGEMEMAIPENTAPMMTGQGPYGGVEMGGMFSIVKVRKDQKPGNYQNPGWFKQPAVTRAFEWTGPLPKPERFQAEGQGAMPLAQPAAGADTEVQVRKPTGHGGH
jgi:hypothetical protein